jgi:uncharacterized BrkB/YihY/UPF0761 family membrane protein
MGNAGADLVQTALQSALGKSSGIPAFVVGATALLITASGVFGEMLSTLNAIWRAQPQGTTVSRLLEACAASIGQVAALGFLLLVSLVKRHPVQVQRRHSGRSYPAAANSFRIHPAAVSVTNRPVGVTLLASRQSIHHQRRQIPCHRSIRCTACPPRLE